MGSWLWQPFTLTAAAEPEIAARLRVHIPFRPLWRSTYLHHYARDVAAAPPADVPAGGTGLLVVASWDGFSLARASRFYYHPQTVFLAVVAEPATHAAHSVRVPFKSFGRNPYLSHSAQDTSVAAPQPDISARFFVRVPFKPFGRNPYVTHAAQDTTAPVVSPFHTERPFLVRVPFKPFGRNPYVWWGSVEGPEQALQVDDAGSNLWVVPVWDRFRLARAQGFYYRGRNDALSAPEPDTYTRRSVRVPFKPFGHNRYILSTRRDDTVPPQDSQTQHIVRVPFRPFRQNRYILSTRRDDTIPPEPASSAPHLVRLPFRAFRPNHYIRSTRREDSIVVPAVDTLAPFFVRLRFKTAYWRNQYRFATAQDLSVVGGFNPAWAEDDPVLNKRHIPLVGIV